MVGKIISGILGKKGEEKKETKAVDDVPDELPPLAEEIVAKASESKISNQPKTEEKNQEKEVPDELPPLAVNPAPEPMSKQDSGTLEDLEKESINIPDAIKKAKLAKARAEQSPSQTQQEPAKPVEIPQKIPIEQKSSVNMPARERITSGAETGFFSNLLEHVRSNSTSKEKLLAGDLFSRMDNYWEIRKHEIKSGVQKPAEKQLEEDMIKKLEELKELEQKWQVQKLAIEEDLRFLHQREREIQAKIEELKLMSNEINLYRTVSPEEYFHMNNGIVLKSLHDLIDILEVIDDETYRHHVNEFRNDFATWIGNVFKDKNLASAIKNSRTKAAIIEAIETMPVMSSEIEKSSAYSLANPKQYLWLENGAVIRNIFELCEALKTMDDSLFKNHVNETKNDFAKWASDALKNSHLSNKLKDMNSRQEMIRALEVFL